MKKREKKEDRCNDCEEVMTEGHAYKVGDEIYYKCNECYNKDKVLRNYQKCEVYSRIVGYLRPVQQWNVGKKQEFSERETFKI